MNGDQTLFENGKKDYTFCEDQRTNHKHGHVDDVLLIQSDLRFSCDAQQLSLPHLQIFLFVVQNKSLIF